MGEYTDYGAEYAEGGGYAEVSSTFRSGQQSPAPYATTTLIGSSKLGMANDAQRYNMFYKTDIYPQMATVNGNYNRSLHSESYANSNNDSNKVNIVENRMATTMMLNQQRHHPSAGGNKRNRLKLMKPQNIRNYFTNQGEQLYVKVGEINQVGPHSNSNSSQQHTPQSQSGSINWSQQNFNIYENQLHNVQRDQNAPVYNGNQSIMSYMSSKDFPENV
jgi:hypothetical protein